MAFIRRFKLLSLHVGLLSIAVIASAPLALAQAKPAAAPIVPDRLPDTYMIYSLVMPGQVFEDMDAGQNQPWAISNTTVNEDDMDPKLAPEATLQPPSDNVQAFTEAVNSICRARMCCSRPAILRPSRRRALP
jgi:hypothetical protein